MWVYQHSVGLLVYRHVRAGGLFFSSLPSGGNPAAQPAGGLINNVSTPPHLSGFITVSTKRTEEWPDQTELTCYCDSVISVRNNMNI